MELDKLNWSILTVLQENARLPFAEIGRKVGLSAPAVAERVQKLEDAGVIKRYTVALDYEKIGTPLQAVVLFTSSSGKMASFLKHIEKLQEVMECHRITGNYCLLLKIAVKSPAHLEEVINRFVEFGETITSVVLSSPLEYRVLKAK